MIDELDDRRLPPQPPAEIALVGADLGLAPRICRGRWRDLDPVTLHRLARLRSEVLVVEAVRPYLDLDDADLADGTEHLWVADGKEPVAYLRVEHVGGPAGTPVRVSRGCSRAEVRHLGLVSALLTDVLARYGAGAVTACARPDLVPFFQQFGFEVTADAGAPGEVALRRTPDAPWR